mmetsp:Transcript_25208/g.29843  ORF Transcript_25208/g.29843 Transcript_25208/m.29843 type:complete len:545 (-) Transcript_25208:163-1797(-)
MVPVPAPTKNPTFSPTMTYVPTSSTESPTSLPSSVPIPTPTIVPIPRPTPPPTSMPVTQSPTLSPTTADTTLIDVSFGLSAASVPTEADTAALKSTIAASIGVAETDFRSFNITYTLITRRLELQGEEEEESRSERTWLGRPRQLATYSWTVTFIVTASPADAGVTSAPELADEITATIESDDFQTAVAEDVSTAVVDTTSVTSIPISPTQQPTPLPTFQPTYVPTLKPSFIPTTLPTLSTKSGSGGNASSATTTYIIIGAVVFFILIGIAFFTYRHNHHHKKFGEDQDVELGEVAFHKYPVARPGSGGGRQPSFVTQEDAETEKALAMLASLGESDDEEEGVDTQDVVQEAELQAAAAESGPEKRLSEIKDRQFVAVNAIVINDSLTFVEKLDKLSNLALSDADFENAKKFVLARAKATSSNAVVSTPNVRDDHEMEQTTSGKTKKKSDRIGELKKDKQLISVSSIVNDDHLTMSEKMTKLSTLGLDEKDFENAKKFVLARSKAGLGNTPSTPVQHDAPLQLTSELVATLSGEEHDEDIDYAE